MIAELLQQVATSAVPPRKAAKKTLALLKNKRNHEDFLTLLLPVLEAKKDTSNLAVLLKFLGLFFEALNLENDKVLDRFQGTFIEFLLEGLQAGNKVVRLRSCQILSIFMNNIEELTEAQLSNIMKAVLVRIDDKDAAVRFHAVLVLSRLQECGSESENSLITEKLYSLLRHDARAEIRRSTLANITGSESSSLIMFERAKDMDVLVRTELYVRLLSEPSLLESMDILSIIEFLSIGFKERNDKVKKAFLDLVYQGWIRDEEKIFELLNEVDWSSASALLTLDELLDGFFLHNPKFVLSNSDVEWMDISASGAYFVKCYCKHYIKDETRVEALIPDLCFWVDLIAGQIQMCSEQDGGFSSDQIQAVEFVISQMLQTAPHLDLSDEAGRRRLTTLLQDILSKSSLNSGIIEHAVFLLEEISDAPADFLASMDSALQILATSFNDCEPDETRDLLNNFKCLEIIQFLLQSTNQTRGSRTILRIVEKFVFPGLDSPIAALKTLSIKCLALCSLNDHLFGQENILLFVNMFKSFFGQSTCVQFLLDWISLYSIEALKADEQEKILECLFDSLDSADTSLSSIAVEGVSKCLLLEKLKGQEILFPLILLYFHPSSSSVEEIRQCLSYFFNAFSKSSPSHQRDIQQLFFKSLLALEQMNVQAGVELVALSHVAVQLLEWTDARCIIDNNSVSDSLCLHALIGVEGLELALEESPGFQKTICQLLGKLYIPATCGIIPNLQSCANSLLEQKIELVSKRALEKFLVRLEDIIANVEGTD